MPGYLARAMVCAWMLATAGASAQAAVRLVSQPDIAAGVSAFPRLAPDGPQAAIINAALSAADARMRAALAECRTERQQTWTRRVTVAMRGPRFLSLVVDDYEDCGSMYPNAQRFALVYDLRTGRPPDWSRLLPSTLAPSASVEKALDQTPVGLVDGPLLRSLYLARAREAATRVDGRCLDDLQVMAGSFVLWPDAGQGGLMVQPFDLPHAVAACGVPALLDAATLRGGGVQPSLVAAIGAARRIGR